MQRFDPQRLRAVRERAALKRETVALEVGRSAPMIVAYETTRDHLPPLDVLERLTDVLSCDVAELFVHEETAAS